MLSALKYLRQLLQVVAVMAVIAGFVTPVVNADEFWAVPSTTADPDPNSVELGMQFKAAFPARVTGMKFYKAPGNGGTHIGSLWDTAGNKVATVTFTGETSQGWQTATFPTAVNIPANQIYTISYLAPQGHYVAYKNYFTVERKSGILSTPKGAGVYKYSTTSAFPNQMFQNTNYWVDVTASAGGTTTTTPTTTTTAPPTTTTTPPPSGGCPNPANTAGGAKPASLGGGCWPYAGNTGVPAGTTLSTYTGPCTITVAGTTIDSKTVNCERMTISTTNVTISKSKLNGKLQGSGFTIIDSEVDGGPAADDEGGRTAISNEGFTAIRVNAYGGQRSILCEADCTVRDSFAHDQASDPNGYWHMGAIRQGIRSTITGNSMRCDATPYPPEAGCSADLTGYPDFGPVKDNLIQGNLFLANAGGSCAYGGSTPNKPFSGHDGNIRFIDNVFQRTSSYQLSGFCGYYHPIIDYNPTAPLNQWTNNTWDDGSPVGPPSGANVSRPTAYPN